MFSPVDLPYTLCFKSGGLFARLGGKVPSSHGNWESGRFLLFDNDVLVQIL